MERREKKFDEFNLKELVTKKNVTAYEVGKATGISNSNIQEILSGKRKFENLSIRNAVKILKYLCGEKELFEIIRKYF